MAKNAEGFDAKMLRHVALVSMGCIALASVAPVLLEIFRSRERRHDCDQAR